MERGGEPSGAGPGRWSWLVPALLALAVGLITLDGDFVYDDHRAIELNPIVTGELPALEAFQRSLWGTSRVDEPLNTYRPLTPLFWRVLWSLSPGEPEIFHAASMLLHCGTVLVLLWAGRRLGADPRLSLATAILFALHPTRAEAVGSAVGQADLLATLLGVWALGIALPAFGRDSTPAMKPAAHTRRAWGAALVLLAACLVKESAFVFGGAIALALAVTGPGTPTERARALLPVLIVTFCVVVFQLQLERSVDEWQDSIASGAEGLDRVLLGLLLIARSLQLCAIPIGLAPNHGYAAIDLDRATLIANAVPGLLLLSMLLAAFILALRRRSRLGLLGIVLLTGPILLGSNLLVRIPTELPERTYYPALIPICGLIAALISKWLPNRRWQWLALASLVVVFAVQSYRVQRPWHSELSLWRRGVAVAPKSLRHQGNLSNALYNQARYPEAAWHMILAGYIYNSYPARVDWNPVAILEQLPPSQRILEAPSSLGQPEPCRFAVGSLRVLEKEIPEIHPQVSAAYRRRYPECFPGASTP